MNPGIRKYFLAAAALAGGLFFFRYLLPLALPFLFGAGLALGADPLVTFLSCRVHLKRPLATAIGITAAFSFLALAVMVLCTFLIRELRNLTAALPELESALQSGLGTADRYLSELADRVPGDLGSLVQRNVDSLFSGGDALLDKFTGFLLKIASGFLSHVPSSALGVGTGIISSFMISAKLPKIRRWIRERMPSAQLEPVISALKRMKDALLGWLKAQLRLSGVTFLLASAGFFLLGISNGLLWALLVALVDAFPILGTGTVLVPWSLVSFLQGDHLLAFGLLGLYGTAALTRSVLEPRFLGKQLGLDPLVTLMSLYAGYRLWGIGGMLVTPMLAVAVSQLIAPVKDSQGS